MEWTETSANKLGRRVEPPFHFSVSCLVRTIALPSSTDICDSRQGGYGESDPTFLLLDELVTRDKSVYCGFGDTVALAVSPVGAAALLAPVARTSLSFAPH